jgi:hypothetical protein
MRRDLFGSRKRSFRDRWGRSGFARPRLHARSGKERATGGSEVQGTNLKELSTEVSNLLSVQRSVQVAGRRGPRRETRPDQNTLVYENGRRVGGQSLSPSEKKDGGTRQIIWANHLDSVHLSSAHAPGAKQVREGLKTRVAYKAPAQRPVNSLTLSVHLVHWGPVDSGVPGSVH